MYFHNRKKTCKYTSETVDIYICKYTFYKKKFPWRRPTRWEYRQLFSGPGKMGLTSEIQFRRSSWCLQQFVTPFLKLRLSSILERFVGKFGNSYLWRWTFQCFKRTDLPEYQEGIISSRLTWDKGRFWCKEACGASLSLPQSNGELVRSTLCNNRRTNSGLSSYMLKSFKISCIIGNIWNICLLIIITVDY